MARGGKRPRFFLLKHFFGKGSVVDVIDFGGLSRRRGANSTDVFNSFTWYLRI